jgi:electron transport complex protein RnfD
MNRETTAGRSDPMLRVHAAPFLKQNVSTPGLMRDVLVALVPVILVAFWYFGLSVLLVVLAATLGAVATEWLFSGRPRGHTLMDGSVILTGILLGLVLPPALPLWMAFLGGVVSVGLGKLVWGGLGHNLFNPALMGRAFLQAAFPTALTTWVPQKAGHLLQVHTSNFALPLMHGEVDAITAATPLARMKFEHVSTALPDLLSGNVAGSLGETSAGLLILCGLWLGLRRVFDWRIPISIVLTVTVFSGILYATAPERFPSPWFMLLSGGLLFGAVFMATDPVTSPLAPRGAWIFGMGIGALVVLIRVFGGLPEGMMYAILLMNAATPLLGRIDQPRIFGRGRGSRA